MYLLLAVLLAVSTLFAESHGPRHGSLLVAGGGTLGPEIASKFLEMAGGPEAPVVLIPTADAKENFSISGPEASFLRRAGFRDIRILHTRSRTVANSASFVAPLQRARAVWIGGGRQWRLVDAYLNTRTEKELWKVLKRGGVIGGSSAGASIQASYLVRGARQNNTTMMAKGYEQGFGFLANIAVDQHLLVRKREKDLFAVVAAHPKLLGIGIDEKTAIIVNHDRFEVIGPSKVLVYTKGEGAPIHLTSGQLFHMKHRAVESRTAALRYPWATLGVNIHFSTPWGAGPNPVTSMRTSAPFFKSTDRSGTPNR